ncbi:MAG TPA: UvrD-helicase domain-containing protein [Gemmatimonadales bacterium]|nr:UvrD-helicase domain-containing protein [Gemmatimonadales bacterium]
MTSVLPAHAPVAERPTPRPAQLAAIQAPLGPVLVLAGPGAGKTFCLIGRIEHYIRHHGISPERICALTFTNRAADEVASRLAREIGPETEALTRGTLHSLCVRLLREHGSQVAVPRTFGIADDAYQLTVLRRLKVWKEPRRRWLLTAFERHRLQGADLAPDDARVLERYEEYLATRNLLDFDQILLKTADLLRGWPEAGIVIGGRWDAVLVDEFQDLDRTQYAIVQRLAPHRNLFVVGDDEQSIFAWRGAEPEVLRKFQREFGVQQPILLDANLRCSRQIFGAARRLLEANPPLFEKAIEAERESPFAVRAQGFGDEIEELRWLLEDLRTDQQTSGLPWGEYALLYRRHDIGQRLEGALITAGIPCALAPRQALVDDEAVSYVVRALRLMRAPDDPVLAHSFAQLVLPKSLMERIERESPADAAGFLERLRHLARKEIREKPDAKKLWRLVYQIENLRGLPEQFPTLDAIVPALLSTRVGEYRSILEDRHEELSDPASDPAVVKLAGKLGKALLGRQRVWVEPGNGVGIAIRGLLREAGVTTVDYLLPESRPAAEDLVITSDDAGALPLPLTIFKALQYQLGSRISSEFDDFVAFDLETTGKDPAMDEIVEVGAVRVRGGKIVDQFRQLVRPKVPIHPEAEKVHGYSQASLADAPTFEQIWPLVRDFLGNGVVVAHNGFNFDIPMLRRMAAGMPGADREPRWFDTLPWARELVPGVKAKLEFLAEAFGVEHGRKHHAVDDAIALVGVARELATRYLVRTRKSLLVQHLDYLGLALALTEDRARGKEGGLLFELSRPYTLGRFSECLDYYESEQAILGGETLSLETVVKRMGGATAMRRIRQEKTAEQRYPMAMARLRVLLDASRAETLEESLQRFLDRVALSTSQGVEADPHRVNLLTVHAAKGLEFSRVYVVGVEDRQFPGTQELSRNETGKIEEARRLLYVGMTRAKDRLVLTRVDRRNGEDTGGAQFLAEMRLHLSRDS